MRKLILGPFFVASRPVAPCCGDVLPLNFKLEWSDTEAGVSIPLFLHRPKQALGLMRLEDIVFSLSELPFDLDCSQYHVFETSSATFLPMEALLSALYTKCDVTRCIFQVLAELSSLEPLHNNAPRRPPAVRNALVTEAEDQGFQLNALIHDRDWTYAEIGWQPSGHQYVFHAGICAFNVMADGRPNAGHWETPGLVGVAEILTLELHRLVPGTPDKLFNSIGKRLIYEGGPPKHPEQA